MTPRDPVWDRLDSLPCETVLADGPRHRVSRHGARPSAVDDPDGAAIIAKHYQDDEGARTAQVMDAIHAALERSPAAVLGTPRLLGYDAARRLLIQEPVAGVRLDTLLSAPGAAESLDLVGRALAALHGLRVTGGRPRRMADHIRDLINPHPSRLALALPALAPRLHRILTTLLETDARWGRFHDGVPVHRDVHPKQLFRDGQRVCLIDWDLSTCGDAALDVGNLAGYLRARSHMNESAVDALLGGYATSGRADVLDRAPLYEALTYVRLSCKRYRLAEPGWRAACAALIARAEQCLRLVR